MVFVLKARSMTSFIEHKPCAFIYLRLPLLLEMSIALSENGCSLKGEMTPIINYNYITDPDGRSRCFA